MPPIARRLLGAPSPTCLLEGTETLRRLGSAESAWLSELADQALRLGRFDRVEIFGLSKKDIILYLDPSAFRLDGSWSTLEAEWRQTGERVPLKDWLRSAKGASISTQSVDRAARALDQRPGDLEELASRVRVLGMLPSL